MNKRSNKTERNPLSCKLRPAWMA